MPKTMIPAFVVCAAVTAVSALVSLGYAVAAVRADGTVALYAAARSVALAVVSLAAFAVGAVGWLEAVACAMIVVQACDAAIGARGGGRVKTFGPAATAVFNAAALGWLLAWR